MRSARTLRIASFALMLLMAAVLLTGCGGKGTTEVTDYSGLFHFVVPGDWQYTVSPGLVTVYGGEKQPAPEAAIGKNLWLQVYSSSEASKTPIAKEVAALAKLRAETRGWTNVKIGKVTKTKLGTRGAYEVPVSATDDQKRPFEGKIVLARVEGQEVLLFGFTEPGSFEKSKFDDIQKAFYWSGVKASDEATAAKKTEKKKK